MRTRSITTALSAVPNPGTLRPSAHRDGEAGLAPEVHRRHHIVDAGAAHNHPWSPVDHGVVHPARVVVRGIPGGEDLASYLVAEMRHRGRRHPVLLTGRGSGHSYERTSKETLRVANPAIRTSYVKCFRSRPTSPPMPYHKRAAAADPRGYGLPPGRRLLPVVPSEAPAASSAQGRASSTRLNGVSVARVTLENPPSLITSANLASPACAPSARPTSWSRDAGVQITVEAP